MILTINNLSIKSNSTNILDNISMNLQKNKITTLIGESGSGKSVLSKSILGLLPEEIQVYGGKIFFKSKQIDLAGLSKLRGRQIFYIPQNAQASLNPVKKISKQILKKDQIFFKDILNKLNFVNPERVLNSYPFELSGGENQRVIIAIALQEKPDLLILDEPTSGLDQHVLKKFVDLIIKVKEIYQLSILLITHKLNLVFSLSDFTYIINQGKIVDSGTGTNFMKTSTNFYTKQLMENEIFLSN